MSAREVYLCQCPDCQQDAGSRYKDQHRLMNLFLSQLNKHQRRWYAAIESLRIGRGGDRLVAQMTGLCQATIQRGGAELAAVLTGTPLADLRKPVGGRPRTEDKYPGIEAALEEMLADEIAGDPLSERKWVRSSTRQLSKRLKEAGYKVGHNTTCRLLRKKGFSMRASIKKRKGVGLHSPDQDKQFEYIASQRREFTAAGLPIISADTKKKELIGNFYKRGKTWCKEAIEVNDYDFPSMAECCAVPYGVYDVTQNRGYVYVGTSGNTPEFAVDSIVRWWKEDGGVTHPGAAKLLILADGGGGNGYRSRAWKQQLQRKLSDGLGLTVTVCHYPPRCSKWNPIERRLFSHISINWAGKPLLTLEMMLGYIRGTSTATGLTVEAFLQEGIYRKGQKVLKQEMEQLSLRPHALCPDWNYTLSPRPGIYDLAENS